MFGAAIAVLILVALTYGWDLGEPPRRGRGAWIYYVFLAAAAIPIWSKLPFTIPLIAETVAAALAWSVFSNDKHPDFAISAHSIFGLSRISYRRFNWNQIEQIEVRSVRRRTLFSGSKPVGWALIFHTNVPRSYPLIGELLGKKHTITLDAGFTEQDKTAVFSLAEAYAPKIPVNETTRYIGRRF
ncbi:MAG: hypothetical protein AAF299_18655 [Pseudomonadota bacterium]